MKRSWLKQIRSVRGMTQRQAAEAFGVSYSMYSKIEAGFRDPHQKLAKRIADAWGFDWTDFYNCDEF